MEQPVRRIDHCQKYTGSEITETSELISEESPVQIWFGDRLFDCLNATPLALTDLAYGYCFVKGIIRDVTDVESVRVFQKDGHWEIRILLEDPTKCPCGQCPGALRSRPADMSTADLKVCASVIQKMSETLPLIQEINRLTGSLHAVAFVSTEAGSEGKIIAFHEDIGRHTALDKVIGTLLQMQVDRTKGFIYMSSRCAEELVSKVACAGISVMATVSAPTSLALDLASKSGMTVCAFARGSRFTVFTHPERIIL